MKMFEVLKIGACYRYVTDDEIKHAQTVYDRYVAYWNESGCDKSRMRSLVQFLLYKYPVRKSQMTVVSPYRLTH